MFYYEIKDSMNLKASGRSSDRRIKKAHVILSETSALLKSESEEHRRNPPASAHRIARSLTACVIDLSVRASRERKRTLSAEIINPDLTNQSSRRDTT